VRCLLRLAVAVPLFAAALLAGQNSTLPAGSRIYIAAMEWQMEQHIAAEIQRQHLPLTVVSDPAQADFVMTGRAEKLSSHMLAPGRNFKVTLAPAGGSGTVWTGEADDYATFFGRLRSHGPARAARVIVSSLRGRFFKNSRP